MGVGYETFLNRLHNEISLIGVAPYEIIVPAQSYTFSPQEGSVSLGRFDGAYFYDFTAENTKNLISLWFGFDPPVLFDLSFLNPVLNGYLNRYNKNLFKICDVPVFQSKLSLEMHQAFCNKDIHGSVILNGAPLVARFKRNHSTHHVNIVITANFRPHKRLYDAISLLNYLNRYDSRDFTLHVCGLLDPLTKSFLEAQNISLENVIFHGDLDYIQLSELYQYCSIGLSTALFDPCPNSVVEMLANGLVVLTPSCSGAAELVTHHEFIIQEQVALEYLPFQSYSSLPKIDVVKWATRVFEILDDYESYALLSQENFDKKVNITVIARQYKNLIDEYHARR